LIYCAVYNSCKMQLYSKHVYTPSERKFKKFTL
jgi:hypothetical protein